MVILAGEPVAQRLLDETQKAHDAFQKTTGRAACLAAIIVGDSPASVLYVRKKTEKANSLGIESRVFELSSLVRPYELKILIETLNEDPAIDAILVQRPTHIPDRDISLWIAPHKDVDGFHPLNAGNLALGNPCVTPCTPLGILAMLEHYKINLSSTCIVGRSPLVGKPLATLLTSHNATVTLCHSKTQNLKAVTQQADLVIVAVGHAHLLDRSFFKQDAYVIDVGINHKNGKLQGDVNHDGIEDVVAGISPVPGGVGPVTIAALMKNTVLCANLSTQFLRAQTASDISIFDE